MEQKMGLVLALKNRGPRSFIEVCEQWGVCPKTGYKWLHRFEKDEIDGLKDRSRTPHHQPHQVDPDTEAIILDLRRREGYGPKKLLPLLQQLDPERHWPATSTMSALLKREGLTARRSSRRPRGRQPGPRTPGEQLNQVWSADYKGWFRTRDGQRFEPLTIMDSHSRYLLRCQAVPEESYTVARGIFEAAFREYGLPQIILTDNGAPFATNGLVGLSRLAVWWIKLGIRPERIQPGRPDQNGRHERMHLTLHQDAVHPIQRNRRAQQARLDHFRDKYNQRRPHEALGQQTPASIYRPSPRPYPRRLPEPDYPAGYQVRQVDERGNLVWTRRQRFFLTHSLKHERVGVKPINHRYAEVYLSFFPLVLLDFAQGKIIPYGTQLQDGNSGDSR